MKNSVAQMMRCKLTEWSNKRCFKLWCKIFKKWIINGCPASLRRGPEEQHNDFNTFLSGNFSVHINYNREREPYHQTYLFNFSFVSWLINSNFQEVIRGLRNKWKLPREICQIYDCLCDKGIKSVAGTPTGDLFPPTFEEWSRSRQQRNTRPIKTRIGHVG